MSKDDYLSAKLIVLLNKYSRRCYWVMTMLLISETITDNIWASFPVCFYFKSLTFKSLAFKSLTSDICVPPAPAPTKEMVKLQQVMIVLFNTYMNSFYLSPTLRINGVFSLTRCTITMQIFSPLFTPIPYSSCFHVP